MEKTLQQYDAALAECIEVFLNKTKDYGTAWRILRTSSITDQIMIKAKRIRTIEELGESKVAEGTDSEYKGIVNYCMMALMQLEMDREYSLELAFEEVKKGYETKASITRDLMIKKNHDYGEAWRDMRISSITDLILMKLLRIKQIEDLEGKTLVSEGLEANFQDIANYALFALIRLKEAQS